MSVTSYVVFGLPLHILLIHVIVVLLPLTAIAVILHAVWPAARRRLGVVTPLGGLVVLVLTPITVSAGEALEAKTGVTPQIQQHQDLGNTLLPWVIALFVIGLVEWVWFRFIVGEKSTLKISPALRTTALIVIIVAALVIAVGSVIDIVLIGDAGARAVWGGLVSSK